MLVLEETLETFHSKTGLGLRNAQSKPDPTNSEGIWPSN